MIVDMHLVPFIIRKMEVYADQRTMGYLEVLLAILRHKFLIASIVIVFALGAGLVVAFRPDVYEARVLLMPEYHPAEGMNPELKDAIGAVTQRSILARGPEVLCLDLLSSERLLDAVIDRLPELSRLWGDMHREDMRKKVLSCCRFEATQSGLVHIAARMTDAQSSAILANTLATELQRLYRSIRLDRIRGELDFVEERLAHAGKELATAEEKLAEFQRTRKMLRPDESATATFSVLMSLESSIIKERAKLDVLKSYAAPSNPNVILQEETIKALKRQLAEIEHDGNPSGSNHRPNQALIPLERLPKVGLEGVRIERELRLREKLHLFLMERREGLKLAEAKEACALKVLKKAEAPKANCGPRRRLWVVLAALLGLAAGTVYALVVEHLRALGSTEEGRKTLEELKKRVWRGG